MENHVASYKIGLYVQIGKKSLNWPALLAGEGGWWMALPISFFF